MNIKFVTIASILLIIFALSACAPTPIVPLSPPTSTQAAFPSDTPVPTDTLTPTPTPTATPIPVAGDFEVDTEGWGDYPAGGVPMPGLGVDKYCNDTKPISKHEKCSLMYQPQNADVKDVMVARRGTDQDPNSVISAWVYVPETLCSSDGCSTARIIVKDQKWNPVEGDPVELSTPGQWVKISVDLKGKDLVAPFQAVSIHYYLATQYRGPFYIDEVTVTSP